MILTQLRIQLGSMNNSGITLFTLKKTRALKILWSNSLKYKGADNIVHSQTF